MRVRASRRHVPSRRSGDATFRVLKFDEHPEYEAPPDHRSALPPLPACDLYPQAGAFMIDLTTGFENELSSGGLDCYRVHGGDARRRGDGRRLERAARASAERRRVPRGRPAQSAGR